MTSTNPSNSTSGPVFIPDDQLDVLIARILAQIQPQTIAGTVNAATDQPAIAPPAPGIPTAAISPPDSVAPCTSNMPVLATQEPSVNQGPICTRCGFQMPMPPEEPYYVVTVGKASLVSGVSGGSFKKYASLGAAQHAYNATITVKIVRMVG
ncbi:hypothetical protein GYMLUDRAFT_253278 [Collybiopsis luxurians FD-317 M1]|uniref:Unplaced genomic scaffold GYMLUscaffold_183, whole genome shotgun sequence n=1 Tax=Collybiopsis luxurians FD-317 M1 TaxID=944289 RepID=A0A0D0BX87_9AGAR|nr:hypothetical protein GYMLUDRAFT_253278 [Collybiopsis luxurians FD-317 M1]